MPDVIDPGGPRLVRCPRCARSVRPGLPWVDHAAGHLRADRAGSGTAGRGGRAPMSVRGLDRPWGTLPEAW